MSHYSLVCMNSVPGVYKSSHVSTSIHTSPSLARSTSTPASLPTTNSTNNTPSSVHTLHSPVSNHGNSTANSAPQLLISSSMPQQHLRLSMATPQIATLNSRHLPRSLGGVPPSALKLAAAATNCQLPKGTTAWVWAMTQCRPDLKNVKKLKCVCLFTGRIMNRIHSPSTV